MQNARALANNVRKESKPADNVQIVYTQTRDAELVIKLANCCAPYADRILVFIELIERIERMRAAAICPNVGERDFRRRSLLQNKLVLRRKQEHAKRAMKSG